MGGQMSGDAEPQKQGAQRVMSVATGQGASNGVANRSGTTPSIAIDGDEMGVSSINKFSNRRVSIEFQEGCLPIPLMLKFRESVASLDLPSSFGLRNDSRCETQIFEDEESEE